MAMLKWAVYQTDPLNIKARFVTRREADADEAQRNTIHFAAHGNHGGYWVRRLQMGECEPKHKSEAR